VASESHESAGTRQSQTVAALLSCRFCYKPEYRSPWRSGLPGVLSQVLGHKEVDSGELGLRRQAGARGSVRESLHSTDANRGREE